MVFSSSLLSGDEFHTHLFGALSELAQHPFAVALLLVVLALLGVFLALGEHGVNQPGELVRRRGHGLGFVHARAQASEVGPQRRLAAAQCRRSESQGLNY